ncbi:MAG: hypothetical protein HYZ65_06765 [Burkholderiales bacterium]|nr:hypothetical protein [Burkholderiales bacterium]
MKKSNVLIAALSVACVPLIADAAEVSVQIRLAAPDALEVSYALPPQCKQLPFLKNGNSGQQIRAAWQALDDCGTAGGEALSRNQDACPVLRFRVPATTNKISGYPGAFPLDGGIYVHTSNYAPGEACGQVSYHFQAPGIATEGQAYQGAVTASAPNGGDTSALLLQAPMQAGAATLAYYDARLSAAAVAQIKEVADGTVSFLRTALPDAVFKAPILAAVAATEAGGPNIGGSASDVLLLSFFNWPQQPGPKEHAKMTLLVAHEFSHRFQMRDAVDDYPDARLIHEGGGEFLRWMTSLQKGWLSHQEAADDLDNALANCVLYTNQKNWRALTPAAIGGNRLEYRCGLPAYVYALAARQGSGSALKRFNDFYKELRQGQTPDFGQALECGADQQCQARWLPLLLGQGAPMEVQWHQLLSDSGLARPRPPTQNERDVMSLEAVVKLMRDDCGGRSSTTETPDGILLDGMSACKTLKADAYVTRIEDQPVFGGTAAGPAMAAACIARHEVRLGMKNGDSLTVPCEQPYQLHQEFYGVDIEKVLAKLLRE